MTIVPIEIPCSDPQGYNVRATVRSTSNKEKTAHLTTLGEALPGNITLHEADLLKPGSFEEVIEGADFVLHTASPFLRTVDDPQVRLLHVQGRWRAYHTTYRHGMSVDHNRNVKTMEPSKVERQLKLSLALSPEAICYKKICRPRSINLYDTKCHFLVRSWIFCSSSNTIALAKLKEASTTSTISYAFQILRKKGKV